jgi:hypothetical protein
MSQITDVSAAIKFLLAGNAIATFVSGKTGARFTYRLRAATKNPGGAAHIFVSVLTGPNNDADYEYIGFLPGAAEEPLREVPGYIHGRKSRIALGAESVRAFAWVWGSLRDGNFGGCEVWHEGRCGRCGRRLTVVESIGTGLGPECLRKTSQLATSPFAQLRFEDEMKDERRNA